MKAAIRNFAADAVPSAETIAKAAGRAGIGAALIAAGHWYGLAWADLAGRTVLVLAVIVLIGHVETVVAARSINVLRHVWQVLLLPVALIGALVLLFSWREEDE